MGLGYANLTNKPISHGNHIGAFRPDLWLGADKIEEQAVGILEPVRVELPLSGQVHAYEKMLVLDEPLWVSFGLSSRRDGINTRQVFSSSS